MKNDSKESATDCENPSFGLPGVASASVDTVLTLKYGVVGLAGLMTPGMPSK